MTKMSRPAVNLLQFDNLPILSQLQIEEALLRADSRNWCLINRGTPPAIVMGISGKPELLVDPAKMMQDPVPLIRRFSGGGTVYVDGNTHFITWICNVDHIGVDCCPCKVHRWTAEFYQKAFSGVGVRLQENDYVIGERKWGGNAQYLCKGRWLHHTSMLWDYDPRQMERLLMPQKVPAYRRKRGHEEFLCRLCEHFTSREELEKQFLKALHEQFDVVSGVSSQEIEGILKRPHRKATQIAG